MTTLVKRTDSDLQQAVLRELRWDTRVEPNEVGVEVKNGVVTLTGAVSSWTKRLAAQEAAHRVLGVQDVANDLDVRIPGSMGRSDTEIAQAVRRALEWNVLVPEERIQSTVSNGWVTLDGTVDTWSQREDAEQCVRHLAGVSRVINKLNLTPSPQLTRDLRTNIISALERHAQREAQHVELDVMDDCVTLSGVVHSWSEKQAILGSVRGTRGVGMVHDQLTVAP